MDVTKELKTITTISNETKQKLRRKTAFSLPDNPSARNMKPNEIKKYLYSAIVDFDDKYIEKDPSIIGIIETLISEVSANFTNLDAYWDAAFEYIEQRINDVETAFNDKLAEEKTAREQTDAKLNALGEKVATLESKGFITKEVANLVNYYLKSEVYNKTEIDAFIEQLNGLGISFKTVNELPETGENKHIYLVPAKTSADKNIYTEWIWVNGAWENIGSTDINLSDYYTKKETDKLLSNVAMPDNYYTKEETYSKEQVNKLLENVSGGGGGGSTNNAKLQVSNTTGWIAKTIASGSNCVLKFTWSSIENNIPTGNGTLKIIVNTETKTSYEIKQGDVEVDNITKYLIDGTNEVKLLVSDIYGNNMQLSFSINVVALSISSYFDGTVARTGSIQYLYTPVGAVEKTVNFILDGNSIGTQTVTVSGREQSFTIPAQSHGNHPLEVYFTAEIDGNTVESNHLYYDLICYVDGNTKPIIAIPIKIETEKQYSTIAIPYSVYTPNALTSSVILKDGNNTQATLTVDRLQQIWSYKALNYGAKTLSITSGETVRELNFTVTENKIEVEAEPQNLELYLTSAGRSNNEDNPLVWQYGDVSAELTGFNLVSDGWKLDKNNNTVLRVSGGARVNIPFNIFKNDFRSTGKTIEIEFATSDVLNYDSVIISSWSGERGIKITAQKALIKSESSEIFTQYKENETVRISFCVEKQNTTRLLLIYINGIMSGAVQYPANDDFTQSVPVGITIGSNDCTTDIYCIRVYNNNLTSYQILDNWIADTQDLSSLIERYERNNIFDTSGNVSIAKIPDYLPYMIINVDSYSKLPQSKGDKKIVSGQYVDRRYPSRSFSFLNAEIDVQGTSSQYYPRKNYKIKFKEGFILQSSISENYQLRPTSMPTNEFTFKADVASSEGANNVELVRLYEDTCPVKTAPQKLDSRVRQGIEGYPILMFYGVGNKANFLGKYNFNNDKATPEVFGFSEGDESWEILQNNTQMVIWKDDNFEGDAWKISFEARYPEDSENTTKLNQLSTWLKSTDTTAVTSQSEKDARLQKFKNEFANYFNKEAMLYNYIFTETFLMVDNRAKNAFPTIYLADNKWLILPYDYDSAIGINNEGELKFGYELEDIDTINGKSVFNGQDSVLYVNIRLAFADEIAKMYHDLRTGDVFAYDEIEKRFEEHQNVWGEAIFNEDAKFKYIDPLINDNDITYLPMLQGSKAEQRKWWLYNRFRYLDSKYNAGDSLEDFILLRSYAVADIEVTPYADIYATVSFDGAIVQKRALRGNSYILENPLTGGKDAVISIYSASQLSNLGDISGLKVGMADFSQGKKLSNLKVGSNEQGYENPNLTSLTVGNLVLLRNLDVRNCTALTQAVDISGCTNIENVYFDGTAITGLTLPNGGSLKKLHLPETITNLTILNQKQLSEFVIAGTSNITTLRIENTPIVNTLAILNAMAANSRVRLIGVDWSIETASGILALMDKLDTYRGLDENGNNLDKAVVSGTIHVPALTGEELAEMNARYPNITIDYDSLVVKVKFYNGETLLSEQSVATGDTITVPENPTKESTAQFNYPFKGWSLDGVNVVEIGTAGTENLTYYAVFDEVLRYYTVRFLNTDGTVLQTATVAYGVVPTYEMGIPVDPSGEGEFNGWDKEIVAVTGDTDYTAKYYAPPALAYTLSANEYSVTGIGTVTDTDIVVPNTYKGLPVTMIGAKAFYENKNITSVSIGDNVKTIGQTAFSNCSLLKTVTFGENSNLTYIVSAAFEKCTSLTEIELPENNVQIASSAFINCSSLTKAVIPKGKIGDYSFRNCTKLSDLTLGNGVTSIGLSAFTDCDSLTKVIIPDSVTSLGTEAFYGCNVLTDLTFGKGITKIPDYICQGCVSLKNINFTGNITSIGSYAFKNTKVVNVTIPETVTTIGTQAFIYSTSLEKVILYPTTPPSLGANAIEKTAGLRIIVPIGTLEAYKTATNWSAYADYMEEAE